MMENSREIGEEKNKKIDELLCCSQNFVKIAKSNKIEK